MIKKNYKDVGFVYKGTQVIDKVYKGTDLVFEQGFVREDSGNVPLSTTHQAIGKDLKDYKIYGNSVQDGTPTPSNPVEIESVGDKTNNLCFTNFTEWESGQYGTTGNKVDGKTRLRLKELFEIEEGQTYYFNTFSDFNFIIRTYDENKNFVSSIGSIPNKQNMTFSSGVKYLGISLYRSGSLDINYNDYETYFENGTIKPYICLASVTNKIYEPYGYKIPVKVKSKNLFDDTTLSNKWINVSGNVVDLPKSNCKRFECVEGETYTLSASYGTQHANNIIVMAFYDSNDTLIRRNVVSNLQNEEITATAPQNSKYLYAGHYTMEPQTIQLEKSDIATEYEPYVEPVITNIYLDEPLRKIGDYSDYIDFNNKKIVRNIGKKVLDGSEKWERPSGIISGYSSYRVSPFFPTAPVNQLLSSHFECFPKTAYTTNPIQNKLTSYLKTNQLIVVISNSIADGNNQTSTTNFTTWLSNNNVDVYFSQDTVEETISLPNIPTIKGTTIFEIDTEIQPSSMYINYKGK